MSHQAIKSSDTRKIVTIKDVDGNPVKVHASDAQVGDSYSELDQAAQVPDFLLIFIIGMSANFLSDLFPPEIKKSLKEETWAQHLVAIIFFLVTVVWAQFGKASWYTMITNTLIAYFWFLLLFQTSTFEFLLIVGLTGVVFVLSKTQNQSKGARVAELIATILVIGITIGLTALRFFKEHRESGKAPWSKMRYDALTDFELFSRVDIL
jgi:hypothetical protein